MVRRKATKEFLLEPYWNNPDVSIHLEIPWKKQDVITPGTLLKITGESRSVYRFIRLVRNIKTDTEWIDVYDTTMGGWRSFYPDRIKELYVAKRSRAKKQT